MAYQFRVRFNLAKRVRIQTAAPELRLAIGAEDGSAVTLRPSSSDSEFGAADELVLLGQPYDTEDEAETDARRWVVWLKAAFARLNIGADFGGRGPSGAFTNAGLRWLEATRRRRVLNDVHGVMVFEAEPQPLFAKTSVQAVVGKPGDQVLQMTRAAARLHVAMTTREQLAYDLYSASFSEGSADARFLMLMTSIETLLEPQPRSEEVRKHIDGLIETTKKSSLPSGEIDSINGSLTWLNSESIGQAGRRLAQSLGDRRYGDDESPPAFFERCYQMRCDLTHGREPRPTWAMSTSSRPNWRSLSATYSLARFVTNLQRDDRVERARRNRRRRTGVAPVPNQCLKQLRTRLWRRRRSASARREMHGAKPLPATFPDLPPRRLRTPGGKPSRRTARASRGAQSSVIL